MPVIATKVGGVRDVLAWSRGLLVDPSDFEGLTRAAEKLLTDRDLARELGGEGRRYVEESHSADKLGKSLVGIYSKVIGRSIK